MSDLKYQAVPHKQTTMLAKARSRPGFSEAYDNLALEFQLVDQMLKARTQAGMTQDAVAAKMGTTKSAVSRMETGGKHTPSLNTLKKYAAAVGCELQVKLVRPKAS